MNLSQYFFIFLIQDDICVRHFVRNPNPEKHQTTNTSLV